MQHRGWRPLLKSWSVSDDGVSYLSFETYFATMRAAEQGLGFALGLFPLTTTWVQAGRLAVPLSHRVAFPGQVSLIHRSGDASRFAFGTIAQWMADEYAALVALHEGRIGCE